MNGYSDHTHPEDHSGFKALIDLATADLYEHNAFRLLKTHVEATEREQSKRKQLMEALRTPPFSSRSPILRLAPHARQP